MIWVSLLLFALALLPFAMTWKNLKLFHVATFDETAIERARQTPVSLLIPARNEEGSIENAIRSILNTTHPTVEVLVLDDASEDRTPAIVDRISAEDARVKRLSSHVLPLGWNGKQHACWVASQESKYPILMFIDADVRLAPDAISRCVAELQQTETSLISGFPKQETLTWSEQMLIPMMYSILLGYLPIDRMRRSTDAGFAAGCGQLFVTLRDVYFNIGGHQSIRRSRHDGIQLPRVYRRNGERTDVFDASDLATCRMYHDRKEVVQGLMKNATEGIANGRLIVPFTLLLAGANILPIGLLLFSSRSGSLLGNCILSFAVLLGFLPRVLLAQRFHLRLWTTLVHPITVLWFLGIQWLAFGHAILGKNTAWRGRKES